MVKILYVKSLTLCSAREAALLFACNASSKYAPLSILTVGVDTFSGINKHVENARCSFSARSGQTAYARRLDRGAEMNRR
jgi:hypothetical protein